MPINPLSSSELESDNDKDKKYNLISGESVNVSGFSPGQSAQQTQSAPTSSGSFTNLQSYLDANKDQAQGLGAKIEDNVQGTVNEGRTNLSKAGQEFNNQIDQAGIDRNAASQAALGNIVNKAYSNPTELSDSDYNLFSDVQNKKNTFEGTAPKDLNSNQTYQDAASKFNQAADKANLTGSEGGREQLLKESFARPSYSKGQSSLDQLLTQNVPENRDRFEKLRTGLLGDSGLLSEENKAIQAASEKRQTAAGDINDANNDIQDYLFNPNNKQENTQFQQVVDGRLVGGSPYAPGDHRNFTSLFMTPPTPDANGNYAPKTVDANKYGVLTRAQQEAQDLVTQLKQRQANNYTEALNQAKGMGNTQQTLGADLTSAINKKSTFDPTLENSLTPDEFSRIQALNKLAGRDPNMVGDKSIQLANDRFDPTVALDKTKAGALIQDKANQFKADMGNTLNQADNATVGGYRFGNMPLPQAADDINNRILDGNPRPDVDIPEADKVINTYNTQIAQANNIRGKYGLEPLDVNNFYDGGSKDAATDKAARDYLKNLSFGFGQRPYADGPNLDRAVDKLMHNPQAGGMGISPEVLQNIQQVATIRALANLVNANRDQMKDPTKKIAAGTNSSGAGRSFFD